MKPLAIVAGSLLLLIIVGIVALVTLVDPNDYKDDIERIVQERTGRALTIGGELDLDLYPWLALRIEDVVLGNPPGYGDEPFATVGQASVGVKLLPLIRQQLEVRRVAVEGLAVELVSRSETENNWKDLLEEEPAQEDEPKPAGGTPSIAGIDVTRSRLVYRDAAEDTTTRLTNLEVHTGRLGGGEPTKVQIEFDFDQGESEPLAHVRLEGNAQLPRGEEQLAAIEDLVVDGRWKGKPFGLRAPSIALDLEKETLAPTELDVSFGALALQATAAGERLFSERVVTGKLAIPKANLREVMRSLEVEVPTTSDPKALTQFALQSAYRLEENALRLTGLDITLDETQIRGTAGVDDIEKKSLAFDIEVDRIDVDRYLEPEGDEVGGKAAPQESAAAKEPGAAKEPTELPLDALRELNARGELRVGRAKLADLEFSKLRLPLEASAGLVRLGPTSGQLFGGKYAGNTVLDARDRVARLSLDERVSGIDIGSVMKATFESDRLVGRGNATVSLKGTGNTDTAILKSLSGRMQFAVEEGAVNGIDLWYELRRARALWKREGVPERAGPPRTPFNVFKGTALLQSGVLSNDDLRIETDYLRAGGKGTIDLESKAIDYRLVAEVYQLPAEGAGAELGELKAAEIPITIAGTLDEPKVRPDLTALVKARVKEKVESEVEKRKEEVKKKLDEKLRDLLGR